MTKHSGILIVDDNVVNRDICAMHLEDMQGPLYFAENGQIALQLAKDKEPDVILLDIMMPEMDGFQVLEQLKLHPQLKNIPVLMLTAKTGTESVVKALEMGANDYLKKPFQEEEMVARVQTLLKNRYLEKRQLQDLASGAAMQQKFLTNSTTAKEICKCANLDVDIINIPYGTISGDFYYTYLNAKGEVVFFLGDSCGHGLPAALLSMRIIGFLQQLGLQKYSGDDILTKLNEDISGLLPLGNFVAATLITFHKGHISVSSGGQPYPLIYSHNGITELEINDFPIGLRKGYEYQKKIFPFSLEHKLLIYTDGIVEATGVNDEEYGTQRLYKKITDSSSDGSIKKLRQSILTELQSFQKNSEVEDDQTLIVFERSKE